MRACPADDLSYEELTLIWITNDGGSSITFKKINNRSGGARLLSIFRSAFVCCARREGRSVALNMLELRKPSRQVIRLILRWGARRSQSKNVQRLPKTLKVIHIDEPSPSLDLGFRTRRQQMPVKLEKPRVEGIVMGRLGSRVRLRVANVFVSANKSIPEVILLRTLLKSANNSNKCLLTVSRKFCCAGVIFLEPIMQVQPNCGQELGTRRYI
jgi:hypothetical protein